jgi:protein TonB
MFGTLESTSEQSTRLGWTTLASMTLQAFALSLLFAISLIRVGGPPPVRWIGISAPASFSPQPAPANEAREHHLSAAVSRPRQIYPPQAISPQPPSLQGGTSDTISDFSAPDVPGSVMGSGNGIASRPGVIGIGEIAIALPPRPAPVKPLLVSHLAEANLLRKVQPVYPPLARRSRIQGAVELRAIVGKTGAIENLVVLRGHPMLAAAAVDAVKQWRYRPYLLNNEPIEVETDITVNFLLSGG